MKYQNIHNYAIAFLFLVAIFSAKSLRAQSEFGVKGGTLYTGFNKTNVGSMFSFEKKNGVELGMFYKLNNFLGPIGLQTELLYQLKGANLDILYSFPTNSETGDYGYGGDGYGYSNGKLSPHRTFTQNLHYISLPVLLTVTPVKFLDIFAGPQFGYLAGTSGDRIQTSDYERFSAGITGGIALNLGINTKLDFRYSRDFTTSYDMGQTDLKNQNFSISVQQTLFRKQKK
jgi:hypothetical protein